MGKLLPLPRARVQRSPAPPSRQLPLVPEDGMDRALAPVLALLFLVSCARVARAIWRHEVFGAEATFALFFALGLPWLAWRWRRAVRS